MVFIAEEHKVKSGIYAIRCLVNDKVYIGCSLDVRGRWRRHRLSLSRNHHHCHQLQRAWNKYGGDQFVYEFLEYVYNLSLLGEIESEYILRYKSTDLRYGFNSKLAYGRQSEETRQKMSKTHRGKKISEEHKRGISEARKGMKLSEEHKRSISETMYGRTRKPHSEETKQKIRDGNRGKGCSEEAKKRMSEAQRRRWSRGKTSQDTTETGAL